MFVYIIKYELHMGEKKQREGLGGGVELAFSLRKLRSVLLLIQLLLCLVGGRMQSWRD